MGLVQVKPQRVEHSDGWAVSNAGREQVEYEEHGRSALIGIDRGVRSSRLYVDTLRWVDQDGGEALVDEPYRGVVLDRIVEGLEVISASAIERYSATDDRL
jgi:hypothetical protein